MTTDKPKKRFQRAPDLSKLLESAQAKNFIQSGEAKEGQAPYTAEVDSEVKKEPAPKSVTKTKAAPKKVEFDEDFDWMNIEPHIKVQHIVRLPAQLKQLILYLGDTTKGQNQTSISVEGLTKIAETMAKEKGLPLPKTWGEWLKKPK